MRRLKHILSGIATLAATVALAATFTVAPAAIGKGPLDDAAWAKNGNGKGGGNGGGKGGGGGKAGKGGGGKSDKARGGGGGHKKASKSKGGGGKGLKLFGKSKSKKSAGKGGGLKRTLDGIFKGNKAKSNRQTASTGGSGNAAKAKAPKVKKRERVAAELGETAATAPKTRGRPEKLAATDGLHRSEMGKFGARPSETAIRKHIEKQKWNGTVGALAAYDLTARAATDYDSLTDIEKEALASLLPEGASIEDVDLSDGSLLGAANDTLAGGGDAAFDLVEIYDETTGTSLYDVECASGATCTEAELMAANAAVDDFAEGEQAKADANKALLEGAYAGAKTNILENANKGPYDTTGDDGGLSEEDRFFDVIAGNMNVPRPEDGPYYGVYTDTADAGATAAGPVTTTE